MNKKIALIRLLEASFVLNDTEKLALLDSVSSMNEKQVQAMGVFLATERQFILEHEGDIRSSLESILVSLEQTALKDKVYVGVGKPN